jgi:hypothetical protein
MFYWFPEWLGAVRFVLGRVDCLST